jgi:hypothetical protein
VYPRFKTTVPPKKEKKRERQKEKERERKEKTAVEKRR